MTLEQKYKNAIDKAFDDAEAGQSKLIPEIFALRGMTGVKTRHFYNNLISQCANNGDARYLEIGTYKGSSVCSAMYNNEAKVLCIDNWSEFGNNKNEFLHNFDLYRGKNDAAFIEGDCYKINVNKLAEIHGNFNIYLYDGNHSAINHYLSLIHYYPVLDDIFIYIVDDWNWHDVREGTRTALKKLNLNVLYEKEVRLTWDNSHTPMPVAAKSWWNGIYIAVLKK
jgi:hypothetical protein